jgi:hypothetical protein
MTEPSNQFAEYSEALNDVIKKGTEMTVAAAKCADADDFGIDARISTAHKFVDTEIKGHAKLLETLIKGPLVPVVSGTPEDSDPIYVKAESYDRTIEARDPWVRVGIPTEKLPAHLIKVPNVLPANASSFRIGLKDYNYIGANYRGQLVLKGTATTLNPLADAADPVTVTAGL